MRRWPHSRSHLGKVGHLGREGIVGSRHEAYPTRDVASWLAAAERRRHQQREDGHIHAVILGKLAILAEEAALPVDRRGGQRVEADPGVIEARLVRPA